MTWSTEKPSESGRYDMRLPPGQREHFDVPDCGYYTGRYDADRSVFSCALMTAAWIPGMEMRPA